MSRMTETGSSPTSEGTTAVTTSTTNTSTTESTSTQPLSWAAIQNYVDHAIARSVGECVYMYTVVSSHMII